MSGRSKLLCVLLFAYFILGVNNLLSGVPVEATEQTTVPSSSEYEDGGELSASAGLNRFLVWENIASGNNIEIFFKRSTDNGATWKPNVNLSTNPGQSLNPQVIVSGSNVFVVWNQYNSAGSTADVYFRRSTDDGATWGPKVKISISGTNFFAWPRISAAGNNVYIAWEDNLVNPANENEGDETPSDIFYRRSTNNGATWKGIINLSNNANDSIYPEIAASGSNVFVTWAQATTGEFSAYELSLRRSTDSGATWKSVVRLGGSLEAFYGAKVITAGSNVYLAFTGSESFIENVYFRRSTDGGATWKPIVNLSQIQSGDTQNQRIAISGSNVYVAWTSYPQDDILFKRSTDGGATWQSTVNITNNPGISFDFDFGVSGSYVFIVWNEYPEPTLGHSDVWFKRSTNYGATWQSSKNLDNNANFPENPQVGTFGSNVFVMWPDRVGETGWDDILSRRSLDNGATWNAVKNLSKTDGVAFNFDIPG